MQSIDSALAAFDPLSLEDLDSCALMNRIDTKYVLTSQQLLGLINSIHAEYRVLEIDNKRLFSYQSLYFDTPNHQCYLEHHNRALGRQKYRIRQYVETGISFLEVKSKNNKGRTNKVRIPLENMEQTLSNDSRQFIKEVTGKDIDLLPQLVSDFQRITLVARNHTERSTIDLNLSFKAEDKTHSLPNIVIVEVKQGSRDQFSPIRAQLKQQHIRAMRVSKYCLGTMLLKPHLKHNRFKAKLRALEKIA